MEPGLLDREDFLIGSTVPLRGRASMEPGLLDREDSDERTNGRVVVEPQWSPVF